MIRSFKKNGFSDIEYCVLGWTNKNWSIDVCSMIEIVYEKGKWLHIVTGWLGFFLLLFNYIYNFFFLKNIFCFFVGFLEN